MNKKFAVGALGALTLTASIAGCSSGSDTSSGAQSPDGTLDTVALMVSDLSNPFFSGM